MKADDVRGILKPAQRWGEKEMEARIAELEAALRSYPREPIGLLKDDAGFSARVLAWHERFAEWQFDLPILPKPE